MREYFECVAAINSLFIGLSNEMGAFESGSTAALFGPVISVVGGGLGTIAVVALVAAALPQLVNLASLHTLRPEEAKPKGRAVPAPVRGLRV